MGYDFFTKSPDGLHDYLVRGSARLHDEQHFVHAHVGEALNRLAGRIGISDDRRELRLRSVADPPEVIDILTGQEIMVERERADVSLRSIIVEQGFRKI